jgi:23S rRNA pseudouridine2605 synthase
MDKERSDWNPDEGNTNENYRKSFNQNRESYGNNSQRFRSPGEGRQTGAPIYSARPYNPSEGGDGIKRKRPRVGESEGSDTYGSDRPNYGGGYGNNRQGGYGNNNYNNRQGGYGNRDYGNHDGGGYNNRQGGGYNNHRQGGNYDGGGYGNREGGYNNRESYNNNREGYNNNREGYNNREGGYNNGGYGNRQGGGYNNGGGGYRQGNGGYNNNRQGGGYNNRQGGGYGNNRPNGGGYGYQNNGDGFRPRNRDYNPNAKYGVKKQRKYIEENWSPDDPIRLNKYLANAGVCSRREADEFIQAGVVKVNDVVVNELGTKIKRGDHVMFHDQSVKLEGKVYVLLNKPKNCVTTTDDPQERMTVMNLVQNAAKERIFPVGRLDRNTTGVLLLTNDGDLAAKLTHPSYLKKKIYHVWLDKPVAIEDMQKIAEGIELEDGEIHADAISYANEEDQSQVGIEIHSGKNRVVRRIFETLGYRVKRLDRVYFAGLTKKNLPRGKWRYLNEKEVNILRMGAFE